MTPPYSTTPYSFQLEDVEKVEGWNGLALVGNHMGTGKTFEFLFYLIRNQPDTFPALVVCPASLKWNWEEEARKHFGLKCEILESQRSPRIAPSKSKCLWIINYDILHYWRQFILDLRLQTIAFDECHYLIHPSSKRTKAAKEIAQGVPHRLGLSGTPLLNRPADLWPVLNIIRPDLFHSWPQFAREHCKPERKPWGWVYNGARKLKTLHKKLTKHMMVRRRLVDVVKDLPSMSTIIVRAKLGKEGRREYTSAKEDFVAWLRKNYSHEKATQAARAKRLTQLTYLKMLVGKLKLGFVLNWVEDFLEESGEKLVLFAVHRKVVKKIHKRFADRAVMVHGGIVGRKRHDTFEEFNTNKKVKLFVGNIDAAGTGWNCTVSPTVAFAELAWTPGKHSQAASRVRGIGRGFEGRPVRSYYLVAHGTIEEKLCQVIQEKSDNIEEVMDGRTTQERLNVFDLLTKELLKGD